mgnify:CR=1 FL=1
MRGLKRCPACDAIVYKKAPLCPGCGRVNYEEPRTRGCLVFLLVVLGAILGGVAWIANS